MYATDNARLPPEHQADVSLKWRERCIAIIQAHMNPVADGLSIVVAAGYTGLVGFWDGANEGKRDDLVTAWRTTTAPELGIDPNTVREPFQDVYNAQGQLVHKAVKDPRRFMRVNKTVYPTIGLALGGGIGAAYGWRGSRYLMAPALGGVGYLTGSMFRDMAYRKHLQKQGVPVATEPEEQGGEGNPFMGYPRSA
jgi:hypothetical protein